MEKIKSLADLKRIKENVQTKIDLREKSEQVESLIQIKVAMATCGIAAGSKDTMNYFIENLEKRDCCRGYTNGMHGVLLRGTDRGNHKTGKRPDRVRTCNDRKSRRNHSEILEE